jgi:hypothetical protein
VLPQALPASLVVGHLPAQRSPERSVMTRVRQVGQLVKHHVVDDGDRRLDHTPVDPQGAPSLAACQRAFCPPTIIAGLERP